MSEIAWNGRMQDMSMEVDELKRQVLERENDLKKANSQKHNVKRSNQNLHPPTRQAI
jgi:FtsZ-binding cell division protein ZapB